MKKYDIFKHIAMIIITGCICILLLCAFICAIMVEYETMAMFMIITVIGSVFLIILSDLLNGNRKDN